MSDQSEDTPVTKKDSKSALVLSTNQQRQLKDMNPQTREVAAKIAAVGHTLNRVNLQACHSIGRLVAMLAADEDLYGADAINQIAAFVDIDPSRLYSYRVLAEEFELDFINEWSGKPMTSGSLLTVNHWIVLSKVKGDADRVRLLGRTLKESFSSRDLDQLIKSGNYTTRRNAGAGTGRKPGVPKSIQGGLQKYFAVHQTALNISPVTHEHVFAAFDDLTVDEANESMLVKLQAIEDVLVKEAAAIERDREEVRRCQDRMRELLGAKANATAAGAPDDDEEDDEDDGEEAARQADKPADKQAADKKPTRKLTKKGSGKKGSGKKGSGKKGSGKKREMAAAAV